MKITVTTLTVDDSNGITTSVHPTQSDAEQCLFDNYDAENEFKGDLQALMDAQGLVVYFDESTVEVEPPTSGIVKTTITVTLLHRADNALGDDLDDVLYEMREGDAVGWETNRVTEPVAADQVEGELIALGNDGTFFDEI